MPATSRVMAVGSSRALTLVWGRLNAMAGNGGPDDQQQAGQEEAW
jgi:hypothetical protein